MHMMNTWSFIENKLSQEKSLYLMVVIEIHGSSPGKQGFNMAVCSDGSLNGSIGGGSMEFKLVEQCKKMLAIGEQQSFIKKQVHKSNVEDGSGMMCSGEQIIAFVPLVPSDIQNVIRITSCLEKKETGILEFSESGYRFSQSNESSEFQYYCSITNEEKWEFSEVIGYKNIIYIIGAGHVGFAVSKLFSQLGFKVVLIDNRPNLSMLNDNPFADEKLIVNYDNIGKYISNGENSYVIIMTNNHTHDKKVLSLLLRKKVKYLGMMGSKEKVATIKNQIINDGFHRGEFNHLHAPIGISISSETPDEIAISIAAEVIQVKNTE